MGQTDPFATLWRPFPVNIFRGVGEWVGGLEASVSCEPIIVLIAVLAIGATLAGLILTSNRGLRE